MPRPETFKTKWKGTDLKFYVRPWKKSDDSVIREVIERNEYEKYGVKLKDSAVWLDCGAHIGTFSAAAILEGCVVYCFEPHPENFVLLNKNLERNGLMVGAKCKEAALMSQHDWNECGGHVQLHLAPKSTSFHSTIQPFRNGTSIRVKAVSLEEFLKKHRAVEGIKMDCEGEEMPLLENLLAAGNDRLLRNINQIVFEWDFKRDDDTMRLRRVIRRLKTLGYDVKTRQTKIYKVKRWTYWPSGVIIYARRP